MSKKTAPKSSSQPLTPFANPQAIIEHIEHESTGTPPTDPYRTRIENIMGLLLAGHDFDPDAIGDAEHMRHMSGGLVLETAARHTGFILGFEYCRDLMLSGAAKDGGR